MKAVDHLETREAREEREAIARGWLARVHAVLQAVAARDVEVRWIVKPEGLVRVGCTRLEVATHSFRENNFLPWPDGSWSKGCPW